MRFALLLALLAAGCEIPPRFVTSEAQVDRYVVAGRIRSACVGLAATEASLRTHTARRLEDVDDPQAAACLCEALHQGDVAVADGLGGSRRDDLATCLAQAVVPGPGEQAEAIAALGGLVAPAGFEAIARLLRDDPDLADRAAAVEALRPSDAHVATLLGVLRDDPDPTLRAGAARALYGRDAAEVVETLAAAVGEDLDGGVRADALRALDRAGEAEDVLCEALLGDPDARVRRSAAVALRGARDDASIACLYERLVTLEESGDVREAVVAALKASPADGAADALCEAIGPVLRLYVTGEEAAQSIPGADIAKAQNDRDWEHSKECVERARRQGGYSCYARNYLGWWYRELGGKASVPWCPGMAKLSEVE